MMLGVSTALTLARELNHSPAILAAGRVRSMVTPPDRLYVLTGAPGGGKTAILAGLDAALRRVPEPAREVLARERSTGGTGTSDQDPSRFVELLLQASIEKYETARSQDGVAVFDRGVVDCVAYAEITGVDPGPSREAALTYRYHHQVLVVRPWEEIYIVDDERTMSFADTLVFQEALDRAYEAAGYRMVNVPRGPISERTRFVRDFVS